MAAALSIQLVCYGTGERASVEPELQLESPDILPDHQESMDTDDADENGDVRAGAYQYPADDPADDPELDPDSGDGAEA